MALPEEALLSPFELNRAPVNDPCDATDRQGYERTERTDADISRLVDVLRLHRGSTRDQVDAGARWAEVLTIVAGMHQAYAAAVQISDRARFSVGGGN